MAGLIMVCFVKIPWLVLILLALPLVIDGFVQELTAYESTNIKRFVTGFLFGIVLSYVFVISTRAAYQFGKSLVPAR